MVKLITKVNGVAALLFHVEHFGEAVWRWRWRIVGDYPLPYLAWREGESCSARVIIHPEVSGCVVEVEWSDEDSGGWRQAALHKIGRCAALFRISALDAPFSSAVRFCAVASIPGDMVACYEFGPVDLAAGESVDMVGEADGPFVDNVLFGSGEFAAVDRRLAVVNLAPTDGACFEVPVEGSLPVLAAVEGVQHRRLFAWRGHGVAPILTPLPEL